MIIMCPKKKYSTNKEYIVYAHSLTLTTTSDKKKSSPIILSGSTDTRVYAWSLHWHGHIATTNETHRNSLFKVPHKERRISFARAAHCMLVHIPRDSIHKSENFIHYFVRALLRCSHYGMVWCAFGVTRAIAFLRRCQDRALSSVHLYNVLLL